MDATRKLRLLELFNFKKYSSKLSHFSTETLNFAKNEILGEGMVREGGRLS